MIVNLSNHALLKYAIMKLILDYAWLSLPMLVGYVLGAFHGHNLGRVKEYRLWSNEVMPVLKKIENERDALWRSAVSKKQKLNRLMRERGLL